MPTPQPDVAQCSGIGIKSLGSKDFWISGWPFRSAGDRENGLSLIFITQPEFDF